MKHSNQSVYRIELTRNVSTYFFSVVATIASSEQSSSSSSSSSSSKKTIDMNFWRNGTDLQ
jgi:hypothetical protein